MSILYPAIYSLVNKERLSVQMVTSEMAELRDELIDILRRRFYYVLDDRVNELYIMACFLDVRYKTFEFLRVPELQDVYISRVREGLAKLLAKYPLDFYFVGNTTNATFGA